MRADEKKCFGCEACIPYCPVEAISMGSDATAVVDEELCVECGNCQRAAKNICGAFFRPKESLQWPRVIRAALSDPSFKSPLPDVKARGVGGGEKTNDVDDYYGLEELGVKVELGRPNSGVSFRDVEELTKALAEVGILFDQELSTTQLMDDTGNGTFPEDVLNQRALTVFVSFKIEEARFGSVIEIISALCESLRTLSTATVVRRVEPGQALFPGSLSETWKHRVLPNGKVNLGLGRPVVSSTERRVS